MGHEITLSIDAMGGDNAPTSVIDGIAKLAKSDPDIRFLLHGDTAAIEPLLSKRRPLDGRTEIRHTDDVIAMDAKPAVAVRRGRQSSLWRALESVRDGEASAMVSAGNTGAMMAMALFCLRRANGVDRPAIAALWPTRGKREHCIVLDMGADVRADAADLAKYAVMGSEYARIALNTEVPRVAVLNVGVEETKGRPEVKEAAEILREMAGRSDSGFTFNGFIEANAIPTGEADVVVTDGFTGNVALKAAEGTAQFISGHLRGAFEHDWSSRLAALFAMASLRRLKRRIDPRRVNGGVFLGLDGLAVKSHGSADATGFAAAVELAATMSRADVIKRIAGQLEFSLEAIETVAASPDDGGAER
jgi:glycerol-3-phosphate acyltransferase PlsX